MTKVLTAMHIVVRSALTIYLVFLTACHRAGPSDTEFFSKATELAERYLNTNALGAEAAMHELKAYTQQCQRNGTRYVDFDQHYAAIYSRLYLVEKKLGKNAAAEEDFRKAVMYWRRVYVRKVTAQPTQEQIHGQIEGMAVGAWAYDP